MYTYICSRFSTVGHVVVMYLTYFLGKFADTNFSTSENNIMKLAVLLMTYVVPITFVDMKSYQESDRHNSVLHYFLIKE